MADDKLEGSVRWRRWGWLKSGVVAWVLKWPHEDLEDLLRQVVTTSTIENGRRELWVGLNGFGMARAWFFQKKSGLSLARSPKKVIGPISLPALL